MPFLRIAADAAVALVAGLHILFLVLEMFFWKKPLGRRIVGLDADFAQRSAPLAANQGLYNGFLAAGLLWGLFAGDSGFAVKVFFLSCVVVAGVFGAFTAKRSILWTQAVPGAVALALVLAAS